MKKVASLTESSSGWEQEKMKLMRSLKETEDMAKTKINTLELEIAQQSVFYKKEEENYELQIKQVKEEIWILK